jgi:hypothetical protein
MCESPSCENLLALEVGAGCGGICPAGSFCVEGSGTPTPCVPGSYCGVAGLHQVSGPCEAGYYCSSADGGTSGSVPRPDGSYPGRGPCPAGFFCEEGTVVPQPCPRGTFSGQQRNRNVSDCVACIGGFYCPAENMTAGDVYACGPGYYCPPGMGNGLTPCTIGHSCPGNNAQPIPCSAGYYQDEEGRSVCKPCPSKHYCPFNFTKAVSQSMAVPCPKGHSCKSGLSRPVPCPPGSHAPVEGLDSCSPCPDRHTCQQPATGVAPLCPEGYFCGFNNSSPSPCPPGTYSDRKGLRNVSECTLCPPGRYCATQGLSAPTGKCAAGYLCSSGAIGASQIADMMMETGHRLVLSCPKGHYCSEGTKLAMPCPAGTYCDGGDVLPTPCEPGTYNMHESAESCQICPGGFMCTPGGIVDYANGSFYATTGLHLCASPESGCQKFQVMYGSTAEDRVAHEGSRNIVQDAAGNKFIAGHSTGTLDPLVPNAGGSDVFVMKIGPDGTQLWVKMLGGAGDDFADDITVDDAGNVFVAMRMERIADFGYDATFGQIIKLDGRGNQLWYKDVGSQAVEGRLSISVNLNSLYFTGTTDMGYSEVSKLDTNQGTPLWASPLDLGLKVYEATRGIAVTGSGAGYVTGYAKSSHDSQPYEGAEDIIVIKFDDNGSSGTKGWTKMLGSEAPDFVKSIALDPSGNVYLAGYFGYEDSPFSKPALGSGQSNGDYDAFLVKYNANGDLLWTRVLGTVGDNRGQSVATDDKGNVYVAGISEEKLPQASQSFGNFDLFVTLFEASGNHVWTKMVGSTASEDNAGVSASSSGLTVVSSTKGSFDGLASIGSWDIVITAFSFECQGVIDGLDLVCPAGHYCPSGIVSIADSRCPRGTYSNVTGLINIAQCLSCPPGMYCGEVGLTKPSGNCSAGYFCSGGAADAIASTCDVRTAMCDASDCANLQSKVPGSCGGQCPQGSYCPDGASSPILCPPGHYCDQPGLGAISGPCPGGYYCEGYGNFDPHGKECPLGDYCPAGSSTPIQCPKGTSSDGTRYVSISDCIQCPAGRYCPAAAGGACAGAAGGCLGSQEPCPAGYFCPGGNYRGTDPARKCPRGHFCLESSMEPRYLHTPNPTPAPTSRSIYASSVRRCRCMHALLHSRIDDLMSSSAFLSSRAVLFESVPHRCRWCMDDTCIDARARTHTHTHTHTQTVSSFRVPRRLW